MADRARLFVKPADLSDGLARMVLAGGGAPGPKDANTDVVRRGAQWHRPDSGVCVRCGGRSDVVAERKSGFEPALNRWQAWEKGWQMRCVCGGLWASGADGV